MADASPLLRVYRSYCRAQAALTLGLAVVSVALTEPLMTLLGLAVTPASALVFRAFAISLLFVSAVHHSTRDTKELSTVRGVAVANVLEDGSLGLLLGIAILQGTAGPLSWALVAIFLGEAVVAVWLAGRAHAALKGT